MEPRSRLGKAFALVLLLGGSVVFAFPFVWLVSTSLKPNEQAASMPPQWIPKIYAAPIEGRRTAVIKDHEIRSPCVLVRLTEGPQAGQKLLIPADDYADGRARLDVSGATIRTAAERIKDVPAGWWYGVEKRRDPTGEGPARWDVVPPEQIEERVSFAWGNYPEAIRYMDSDRRASGLERPGQLPIFVRYLLNTMIVCVLGVIGTVCSCSLAAYGLARIPWRGRGILFAVTLGTMMVPFPALMVPLYGVFKALGWVGTLKPLWVPAFFGSGFNIFLMRQFFLTIPKELSEAARIDGCSELGIFLRIVLPLSKPVLAVVALFHFLYAWNDFMGPLLYLTRQETFTLSLGLQAYQSQHGGTDWAHLMAASTMVVAPILVLFFFTQRTVIKGIATTGMKG
ncbi:MAG TPA: carbohydrate ABC transporter permease [Phycisphaerae bacterium]|nr:carbohydrate ABC transporter permease [Phycisphaerae bacterium]